MAENLKNLATLAQKASRHDGQHQSKINSRTTNKPFGSATDPGIVVDMEIQPGDPVDSQIIRNFMGEFEKAKNDKD